MPAVEALALVQVLLGDREEAMTTLERLLTLPSATTRARLRVVPHYASLRDHPRFTKLVED